MVRKETEAFTDTTERLEKMTAFDSSGDKLYVYFDSRGRDIQIGVDTESDSYDEYSGTLTIMPEDIPQMIIDLQDAYGLRGVL